MMTGSSARSKVGETSAAYMMLEGQTTSVDDEMNCKKHNKNTTDVGVWDEGW